MVKELGKEDDIDKSYYIKLVDEAYDAIAQYGDAEWFISDDPVPLPKQKPIREIIWNIPIDADELVPFNVEDTPPWDIKDGKTKIIKNN